MGVRVRAGMVAACLAAFGASACGGGDDSAAGSTTTVAETTSSTAEPATDAPASSGAPTSMAEAPDAAWPPAQDQLDAALLTIDDMPTGWAVFEQPDESDPPCGLRLADFLGIDPDDVPRSEFAAAEDEDRGPMVMEQLTVLPPNAPADLVEQIKTGYLGCDEDIVDGFDTTLSELSFPALGDESFAIRLGLKNDDAEGHFDYVFVRSGAVLLSMQTYDQFGDATALLEEYAPTAVERAVAELAG